MFEYDNEDEDIIVNDNLNVVSQQILFYWKLQSYYSFNSIN